jgi:adenosylmethionine-8-amino-7-oxononanoate aminotransferase
MSRPSDPFDHALELPAGYGERLGTLDRKVLWKPFTQMAVYEREEPMVLVEGRGAWLRDAEGRAYLDANASLWVNVHGHAVPEITHALRDQLSRLDHATLLGPSNDQAILFASELVDALPDGLTRVFYSDNGSTAVEVALKMAYQYHQQSGVRGAEERRLFVSLEGAYHGDTLGSVSVGGIDLFHGLYRPLLFDVLSLPQPDYYRRPDGVDPEEHTRALLAAADGLFEREGHRVAALVVEPLVQGAAGMVTYPPELLVGLAERARAAGALLVLDEVATGFGRTGAMFACQRAGVVPDLIALAKGISGGVLPLAATVCTETIYDAFKGAPEDYRTFFHGHSYTGNPLACAAARASLRLFREGPVLERVEAIGAALERGLADLGELPHVGDVRRCGVMSAVELVADKQEKRGYDVAEQVPARVCRALIDRGIWIRPLGGTVVINPPFCIRDEEVRWLCEELAGAIEACCP